MHASYAHRGNFKRDMIYVLVSVFSVLAHSQPKE